MRALDLKLMIVAFVHSSNLRGVTGSNMMGTHFGLVVTISISSSTLYFVIVVYFNNPIASVSLLSYLLFVSPILAIFPWGFGCSHFSVDLIQRFTSSCRLPLVYWIVGE